MSAAISRTSKIALAFLTVYLVWGSTYLAIRVGVADLPPALFAGARFVISGIALGAIAHWHGMAFPRTLREWKITGIVGVFLLAGGNGLVVWGEQWVPSNQAALIVATTALWLAGLGTLGAQGQTLTRPTLLGLVIGFLGVVLLLYPNAEKFSFAHFGGQLGIMLAALLWASGSIYNKRRPIAVPLLMAASMQMLVGGLVLCAIGLATGEVQQWKWTLPGLAALGYLIVFGSSTYAVYIWLLHNVTPAQLGTYAYVNPAVAVALGWWLLDERLSAVQVIAMLIILTGVLLVSITSRN
ncbi:MAG: EamA family transporter [Pseudomonadota bacterium]